MSDLAAVTMLSILPYVAVLLAMLSTAGTPTAPTNAAGTPQFRSLFRSSRFL
jgi:hypothetical protein